MDKHDEVEARGHWQHEDGALGSSGGVITMSEDAREGGEVGAQIQDLA